MFSSELTPEQKERREEFKQWMLELVVGGGDPPINADKNICIYCKGKPVAYVDYRHTLSGSRAVRTYLCDEHHDEWRRQMRAVERAMINLRPGGLSSLGVIPEDLVPKPQG